MLNKETLNKQKHIYEVYISYDDEIHIEKFSVIYINKSRVYFKRAGTDELSFQPTSRVKDNFNLIQEDIDMLRWKKVYFWNVDESSIASIEEAKELIRSVKFNNAKREAELRLNNAKRQYEIALANYRKYEENIK